MSKVLLFIGIYLLVCGLFSEVSFSLGGLIFVSILGLIFG